MPMGGTRPHMASDVTVRLPTSRCIYENNICRISRTQVLDDVRHS